MHLLLFLVCQASFWLIAVTKDGDASESKSAKKEIYELVDWTLISPQWLDDDLYDRELKGKVDVNNPFPIKFPHFQRRYGMTQSNQELIILSQKGKMLVPVTKVRLEIQKRARHFLQFKDYQPIKASGMNFRHKYAEENPKPGIGSWRAKTFGTSTEILLPLLYMPTGWMLIMLLIFFGWVIFVPVVGGLLIEVGSKLNLFFYYLLFGPLKRFLRMIIIRREVVRQKWLRILAPPHYLVPRSAWKLPYFLRHDYLEDVPPELAYKPPPNKIDYTKYILNPQDYDDVDLEMDELEFIDEMLQFREQNPNAVARLLKYRLGIEKFYNYFDEDILSDEEAMDYGVTEEEIKAKMASESRASASHAGVELDEFGEPKDLIPEYLKVFDMEESWMFPEFDETFEGSPQELEEIRARRQLISDIKEEILYLHRLITHSTDYTGSHVEDTAENRRKLQNKAKKLLDKYLRYSKVTKERIEELEPSSEIQYAHNVALNKYLPLIDKMSHYNHRLNLRHVKIADTEKDKRAIQLDTFGGP